jgi:hypothetical protein
MNVTGVIKRPFQGRGFVVKPGSYTGELDGSTIWVMFGSRRIGLPVSTWQYYEDSTGVPLSARSGDREKINDQIKAAMAIAAANKAKAVPVAALPNVKPELDPVRKREEARAKMSAKSGGAM